MNKLLIAAAFTGALLAAPVSAQMYAGAGVGQADTDSSETSWKLYGGYQINPTWGVELGYNDLGRYSGSNIQNWTIAGTGTMPLNANWALLGKLGLASNRPSFTGASNHTALLMGIGVGYSFSKNVGVRLEYEDFGKLSNVSNGSNSRGSNLGLSVKYTF